MKAVPVKTLGQMAREERVASRDAIQRKTEADPALVGKALSTDPTLLNGYAEAQVLIDILFAAGQVEALSTIQASKKCSAKCAA